MLNNRCKKLSLLLLFLMLALGMSACGDNNFTVQEGEEPVVQETAEVEEETEDLPIPVADGEIQQTVTIKADSSGAPMSAKLRTSGEDMEENVDIEKIPFGVRIRYFLEGEEVTAEEIEGATGNVKIRFDYENKAETTVKVGGKDVTAKVPLVFVSIVTVPEDKLYNVEVNNGDVTEASGNRVIYGYAVPELEDELKLRGVKDKLKSLDDDISFDGEGIPDYLEIKGYAKDLKLDFTATMVMNGIFKDLKKGDLDDLSKTVRDLDEFSDGGDELADGVSELKDGASKFGDGLDKYVEGAGALKDGVDALSGGASQINDGADALKKGAAGLATAIGQLDENGSNLKNGAKQLKDGLAALKKGLKDAATDGDGTDDISVDPEELVKEIAEAAYMNVMESLEENTVLSEEEKSDIAEAAASQAAKTAVEQLAAIIEQATEGSGAAIDALGTLSETIEALAGGASALYDGVSAYTDGVSKIKDGADQLEVGSSGLATGMDKFTEGLDDLTDGAGTLASSGTKLTQGYDSLESGIGSLKKGVDKLNKDLFQKIGSLSTGAIPETINRLKAMRLADRGFTAWDTYDGEEGSIVFILETE